MPHFLIRPFGAADGDMSLAQFLPEQTLPQEVPGVAAGQYEIWRCVKQATEVVVTDPPVVSEYFSTNGTNYFSQATNVSNLNRLRYVMEWRMPSTATYAASFVGTMIARTSTSFDVVLTKTGEEIQVRINKIEHNGGTQALGITNISPMLTYDTWYRMDITADLVANTLTGTCAGQAINTPLTDGADIFEGRFITYLNNSAGNSTLPAGVQVRLIEVYQGIGTDPMTLATNSRISGSADVANAHPWKLGTGTFT